MSLDACLPAHLRGPSTTIQQVAAGLSGAGVYRVEAAGQVFVLKISAEDEPLGEWKQKAEIYQSAANAGLAPAVVHVDASLRAIVSVFVVDRSFAMLYRAASTHEAALTLLGRTLRRVHDLPLPNEVNEKDPRALLETLWADSLAGFSVPSFVVEAVQHTLSSAAPVGTRANVLSHNDVNPTNLTYDGESLLLLDWDTAGANNPLYDLATISVFLRMDQSACLTMLGAHDGAPVSNLPPEFAYYRRMVAVLCGSTFLLLARQRGHAGSSDITVDSALSLGDVYQRMQAGSLSSATAEGLWSFGLALVKSSLSP